MDVAEAEFSGLYQVLERNNKTALAVSGGSDSCAMMVLASQWAAVSRRIDDLHVLIVDHRLRKGSAAEADRVQKWAQKLGFDATVLTWHHTGQKSAVQQKAREARYEMMGKWCVEHDFDGVVCAHTLNDQTETLLMRLARGSGVEGLAGMNSHSNFLGLNIFRPLLGVDRDQLRKVLINAGHDWIDDPSNKDEQFERVRLRQLAEPLASVGILPASLGLSVERINRANAGLDDYCDRFMQKSVTVHETGYCSIKLNDLRNTPADTAIRSLGRLIDWAGGGEPYFKLAKLERLYRHLMRGDIHHHTLAGAQIVGRTKDVVIGREFGRIDTGESAQCMLWDNRFVFDQAVDVAPYGVFIDDDRRLRPDGLPHFVACCLPAICKNGVLVGVPHLDMAKLSDRSAEVKLAKRPKGLK